MAHIPEAKVSRDCPLGRVGWCGKIEISVHNRPKNGGFPVKKIPAATAKTVASLS
jgi:hypothetical protein